MYKTLSDRLTHTRNDHRTQKWKYYVNGMVHTGPIDIQIPFWFRWTTYISCEIIPDPFMS